MWIFLRERLHPLLLRILHGYFQFLKNKMAEEKKFQTWGFKTSAHKPMGGVLVGCRGLEMLLVPLQFESWEQKLRRLEAVTPASRLILISLVFT